MKTYIKKTEDGEIITLEFKSLSDSAIRTYKARDIAFDKQIAEFVIGDDGTELIWL